MAASLLCGGGAHGIEFNGVLHDAALVEHRAFATQPMLKSASAGLPGAVTFQCGDFFASSWSSFDIIYSTTVCFSALTRARMRSKALRELRPGSFVLVVGKPLVREDVDDAARAAVGEDTVCDTDRRLVREGVLSVHTYSFSHANGVSMYVYRVVAEL